MRGDGSRRTPRPGQGSHLGKLQCLHRPWALPARRCSRGPGWWPWGGRDRASKPHAWCVQLGNSSWVDPEDLRGHSFWKRGVETGGVVCPPGEVPGGSRGMTSPDPICPRATVHGAGRWLPQDGSTHGSEGGSGLKGPPGGSGTDHCDPRGGVCTGRFPEKEPSRGPRPWRIWSIYFLSLNSLMLVELKTRTPPKMEFCHFVTKCRSVFSTF